MTRAGIALAALLAAAAAARAQVDLGPEFQVNTYTGGNQDAPAVAMHGDGSFVVVWQNLFQDFSCYPYICDAPDDSASGVFLQRFDSASTPVGGEQHVNTFTLDDQFDPDVSRTDDGGFVVTWSSGCVSWYAPASCSPDGFGPAVAFQRFDASGTRVGPEQVVNTFTPGFQGVSAVSATPVGEFVIVWQSASPDPGYYTQVPDHDPRGIAGRAFGADGVPAGDEFQVSVQTTGRQEFPDVTAHDTGFVVTWTERGDSHSLYAYDVLARRFDAHGSPLGDVTVSSGDQYVSIPSVSAAPDGEFVVVWQAYTPFKEGYEITGRRFAADDTPAGPAFRVNTNVAGDQVAPSVAADAAGNFVVSWMTYDYDPNAYYEIVAQAFAHDGAQLGGEFHVNAFTTGRQKQPAVAAGSAGTFVVTWSSNNFAYPQDGDHAGVFARRITFHPCSTAAECDDANVCTTDACEGGVCLDRRQPDCCQSAAECWDDDPCTDDVCTANACSHPAIPDCVPCRYDNDCTPPDACSTAACDYEIHRCEVTPLAGCCVTAGDCDDGHACTADTCSVEHTCSSSPIPDCIECTDAADCARGCLIGPEECVDGRCEVPAGCPLVDIDTTDPVGAQGQLLSRVRIPADVPGQGKIKVVVTGTIAAGDSAAAASKGCRSGKRIGRSRAVVEPASDTNVLLAFSKRGARCLAAAPGGTLPADVNVRVRRKKTPLSEVTETRVWRQ